MTKQQTLRHCREPLDVTEAYTFAEKRWQESSLPLEGTIAASIGVYSAIVSVCLSSSPRNSHLAYQRTYSWYQMQ